MSDGQRVSTATLGATTSTESYYVESTAVAALVRHLSALGVEHAFGVSGGAIAAAYDALVDSDINMHHFRHETGAAFAAAEAYFATGKPTLVLTTTGPGVLNALTGIAAAKWDGAKVVLMSGATNAAQRGRWATQETSSYTIPQDALISSGMFFDFAVRMEDPAEHAEVARRLWLGFSRPGGFVAHISLPISLQANRVWRPRFEAEASVLAPAISSVDVTRCAEILRDEPFAVWLGFGSREAAASVRTLVEMSGAPVFCSPRGKGIVPEDHAQFVGVTGLGGHVAVTEYMSREKPRWVLVLGSRLGEATSFWDSDMVPSQGFIHVDLDPTVPGVAYPGVRTIGVQADIGQFVDSLLKHVSTWGTRSAPRLWSSSRDEILPLTAPTDRSPVRPQALMRALQEVIVERSDAVILAECGNAFAWCSHYLFFTEPQRYRVSTLFGSMGHSAAGVVGAALGRNAKAVAVVGDGSMLMNSEISTAAQYGAQAVWVVLNDAGYGMVRHGHKAMGIAGDHLDIPRVDFVDYARALGADGMRVDREDQLHEALELSLSAAGPFVVDVQIDPAQASPLLKRVESLKRQNQADQHEDEGPTISGWSR